MYVEAEIIPSEDCLFWRSLIFPGSKIRVTQYLFSQQQYSTINLSFPLPLSIYLVIELHNNTSVRPNVFFTSCTFFVERKIHTRTKDFYLKTTVSRRYYGQKISTVGEDFVKKKEHCIDLRLERSKFPFTKIYLS